MLVDSFIDALILTIYGLKMVAKKMVGQNSTQSLANH